MLYLRHRLDLGYTVAECDDCGKVIRLDTAAPLFQYIDDLVRLETAHAECEETL